MTTYCATTTMQQLTGSANAVSRLCAMIGAHNFLTDSARGAVQFRFKAKAKNGANHADIALAADDTYTITFTSIRGMTIATKQTIEGVYADNLKGAFERSTGLALSL